MMLAVAEATTDCADCARQVPVTEIRNCDTCGRPLCEDCTEDCVGFAGKGCRDCHTVLCTSRECWD